ncbi:MAG: oligoribonuclease [Mariprofundaceae bacterium]
MPPKSYLVWMDMEMSGLNPDRDHVLEIATLITDSNLEIVAEGPELVVHQPQEILDGMDEWCRKHHRASGLTAMVQASTISLAEAEEKTLAFLQEYIPENGCPLCGNSIHQDRRFLYRYMPQLEAWLHYRNIDVSSLKEVVKRWYPNAGKLPRKKGSHRALHDIRESIEELRYYRKHFFVEP